VEVLPEAPPIFIEGRLEGQGGTALATIQDRHDHIGRLEVNGRVLRDDAARDAGSARPDYLTELMALDMPGIWDLAGRIDADLEAFLLRGVEMNMAVAPTALTGTTASAWASRSPSTAAARPICSRASRAYRPRPRTCACPGPGSRS
jgi:L-cysteine desulfidase